MTLGMFVSAPGLKALQVSDEIAPAKRHPPLGFDLQPFVRCFLADAK